MSQRDGPASNNNNNNDDKKTKEGDNIVQVKTSANEDFRPN